MMNQTATTSASGIAVAVIVKHETKPSIPSFPENVIIRIMSLLGMRDLDSFVSTCVSTRRILKSYPEQIIAASLAQSLSNTELMKWFPFPDTIADLEPTNKATLNSEAITLEREGSQKDPSTSPMKSEITAQYLLCLRHANRVCKVSDGVSFFSRWLHRVEKHDGNGNHDCSTEYRNIKLCNETLRVVLFLAQNEVYGVDRYLRHCTVEERIAARCDPQVFDKIELPLPDNWWIRDGVLRNHRGKLKEIEAEASHGKDRLGKYLDYLVTASRDESFQHRRMWMAKYLTKEANVTPARKIEEFEKLGKTFWYTKGIVTGIVFTQIAPLSWWHDSMVMGAWQPKDRNICGFENMRNVSIFCYQKAVKVVERLDVKY
ncbi:hypothetical protein TWF281_001630 [Arthrobotrys megalospora]